MAIKFKAVFLSALVSSSIFASELSLEVQVDNPLSAKQKETLRQNGVATIRYAGKDSYYLYAKDNEIEKSLERLPFIKAVKTLNSKKLDCEMFSTNGGLSTLSYQDVMKLSILFFDEMSKEDIEQYFEQYSIDAKVLSANKALRSATIRIDQSQIDKLKNLGKIEYIQKAHTLGLRNVKTRNYEGVNSAYENYGLDGKGTSVAVVDGGMVREDHVEFNENGQSRIHIEGNYDFADHATHVAGTIGAKGVDKNAKGMAPKATIYSFSFY